MDPIDTIDIMVWHTQRETVIKQSQKNLQVAGENKKLLIKNVLPETVINLAKLDNKVFYTDFEY